MARPKGVMHNVRVTVTKDGQDGLSFAPSSSLWSEDHGHFAFHKAEHKMRPQDYHLVEFVLDDRTGDSLAFPAVPHDAMWVAKVEDSEHPTCPDAGTSSNYDVVEPICVCDNGQRLIVRNDDPREEQWSFTLNLKKGDGETVSWDPIINNGGNGGV
jgi:hypothetical protein